MLMAVQSKLFSLPHDVHREIEDVLVMSSLLALGATCQYFHDRVSSTLRRERDAILRHYWVNYECLLHHLKYTQAIVSGEAALAFITRDRAFLTDELEICVSSDRGWGLLELLEEASWATRKTSDEELLDWDRARTTEYVYKTPSERFLRIRCSHTLSPFTPMVAYPTTALFNYFDAYSFGCAYRDLTMNGRAVVPQHPWLMPALKERVARITEIGGFLQSKWPAAVAFPPRPFTYIDFLAPWGDQALPEQLRNTTCLRKSYQCPGQSRFFGDKGSLVEFFSPDKINHAVMAHLGCPPYGTTTVWRMDVDHGDCDYHCGEGDHLLPVCLSETAKLVQPICYGRFTTELLGSIKVGESQHERVWNTETEDVEIV